MMMHGLTNPKLKTYNFFVHKGFRKEHYC